MICETVARSGSPEQPPPTAAAAAEIWGTWEDLLLACAVSRLGSKTWDSVASEVRSRSPAAAAAAALLTPDACRRRYRHLQSQFSSAAADAADGVGEIPWVEELRKLRVAELRREVQRYDVSIGSLQLKVKRLKEECERTLGGAAANGEKGPDLKAEEDRKDLGSPGSGPADRISAGDSGRSCKESNSTDPKGRGGGDGQQPPREATDDPCPRGQSPALAAAAEEKSVGESSYNGSSDTIARGAAAGRTDSGRAPVQEVGESGESFAESKGVEAESRNSDVQSSAGLPRRRRGRRRKAILGRPGGGGDENEKEKETDGNSVRAPEESQPLLVFLEIIRSHKCGFMFESRLKSQDGAVYNGLVKQHVDLEMVRGRITGGGYTRLELFRDLLLICNNAIVYYQKESPEFNAAVKLRQLVNNEISATSENSSARPLPSPPPLPPPMPMTMPQVEASKETTKKEATPPPAQPPAAPLPPPAAPKLKPEPDLVRPSKPGPLPPPLIACKKRSSITTKPPAMMSKKEAKAGPVQEEEEENGVPKEKVKERRTSVSGTRGPRTNKSRGSKGGGGGGGEMVKSVANRKLDPAEEESDAPEPAATKAEKEKKTTAGGAAAVAKKRSAAIFLDRLNRAQPKAKGGAPSAKGELMETLKATGNGNGGAEQKKGEQQRKGGGGGGGGRKEQQATRQSTSAAAKQAAAGEQSAAPVKRGRPPKRAAPPLPLTPPAKRAREEKATPQPSSRKRGRR